MSHLVILTKYSSDFQICLLKKIGYYKQFVLRKSVKIGKSESCIYKRHLSNLISIFNRLKKVQNCVYKKSSSENMFSHFSYPSFNNGEFVIYFAKGYTLNWAWEKKSFQK